MRVVNFFSINKLLRLNILFGNIIGLKIDILMYVLKLILKNYVIKTKIILGFIEGSIILNDYTLTLPNTYHCKHDDSFG